ncbi:hypothetical protein [Aeromicrobium fastidiosum]|uniref:Lipoprotein n=1 Tax=Aeromicrobium fastidiosum TaxID=52699 RepID=A0A641AJG1_9ACTN|nr:hypothetical protein [Aeromicrobium fastidiosum]KAA1375967.1 hypothetical protein ESP62_010920 [Aeromicrobium fastidiosum]MBP2392173.1 hypothetical protein [Aeromicrobium fastidiosum]
MKLIAGVVATLALSLSACTGGDGESDAPDAKTSSLSAAEAFQATCVEVRAGIAEFNDQDYAGTVEHFEKAKIPAKVYAKVNTEPEADALLDAVEYYADLSPADYPEAALSSKNFARNKEITLTQCASDPDDQSPGTPV